MSAYYLLMMVCRREGYLPDWLKSSVEWEVLGEKLAQIFIYQLLSRNILLSASLQILIILMDTEKKNKKINL